MLESYIQYAMLGCLGSGAGGAISGGGGVKVSPEGFYIVRGRMNQTRSESCQTPGNCEWKKIGVRSEMQKAEGWDAAGEHPAAFLGYGWSR